MIRRGAMRFVLRLVRIVFTLLRFGVDEMALSAFPQRSVRLLMRVVRHDAETLALRFEQ